MSEVKANVINNMGKNGPTKKAIARPIKKMPPLMPLSIVRGRRRYMRSFSFRRIEYKVPVIAQALLYDILIPFCIYLTWKLDSVQLQLHIDQCPANAM